MEIIISTGAKISEYTVEPIGRQLGYLFNYKSNIENLRTQIQHLKDAKDKLQHSIDEAKKNSDEEIEADVANWLSRVDRMISQHSETFLANEGRANTNCLSGKFPHLGSRHRMSRKAKKMASEAATEIQAAGGFHKGVGSAVSAYGGPSSSQSAQEQSLFSSSEKGALKCQSSVLDNDIGSIGPPVSGSVSISRAGLGSMATQKPSSSIQKLNSSGELKNDYREASTENEKSIIPCTSFSSVPTKSSEMASKILQQLDKLVSPKDESSEPKLLALMDKSPTNQSPSMLHGQALESLEGVDSSNFLVDVQENKLDGLLDKTIPDDQDTTSLKQDMVKEIGQLKIVASCDEATAVVNGVDSAVPKKNTSMSIETTVSDTPIFVASPSQKKWAFRMSVPEDFLELDDDDDVYSNDAASHSLTDGRQKVEALLAERKSHNTEAVRLEKAPAFVECKPSTPAVNKKPEPQASDGSVLGEKNSNFVIAGVSSPSMAVLHTEVATQSPPLTSDIASPPQVSNVALPISNFGDKVESTKDSDAASPICSFGSKPVDKAPETFTTFASSSAIVTESAATGFGSFSDPKPETSSSFPTVPANATDSVLKVPEPSKVGINDISDIGVFSSIPETGLPSSLSTPTPTSTTSTFSFGNLPNSSILNNGSLASTSATPVDFISLTSQNSSNSSTLTGVVSSISTPSVTAASTTVASSSSLLTSTPAPSFPARSVLKFVSTASTAVAPVSATLDLPSSESTAKKDMGFGIRGTQFGVTAAATASTGSSIFGFGATATSTTDNQSQGATFGAGSNSQALSVGTAIASSTQSIPIQLGSTTSSPSSSLAGNTISTGSSIFVSSAPAKVIGSGSTELGSSASASDTNPISSGSGTPTTLLGSTWQHAKSSIFVSTGPAATTNSAPMVFGASTGSAATTNSAPAFFGSSNGASTSSIFSFTTPPVSASTQPVFGNPSPAFPFSSTASANNDQMNMEDSMAEDTVASVPSVPVFGQQPVLPSPSPSPPGFAFGSASASSTFQFGSQLKVDKSNRKYYKVKGKQRKR